MRTMVDIRRFAAGWAASSSRRCGLGREGKKNLFDTRHAAFNSRQDSPNDNRVAYQSRIKLINVVLLPTTP